MKLPKHVLERIDYYEVKGFVRNGIGYDYVIIVYWKPEKRKFLWITSYVTPQPKVFSFEANKIPHEREGWSNWQQPRIAKELEVQLEEYFTNLDYNREDEEIENMIQDLLDKDEH